MPRLLKGRACTAKLTEATATSLAKRRRDHEAQQIAKVRRQEELEAASRARDEIRDNEAFDLGDADNLIQRSPSPPVYRLSGLPNRRRRLPKRFRDDLPPTPIVVAPSALDDVSVAVDHDPEPNEIDSDQPIIITTARNHYGIYREYSGSIPSFNPNNLTSVAHISDAPTFDKSHDSTEARPWWSGFGKSTQSNPTQFFTPFLNATTFWLMRWFYGGSSMKSLAELDCLIEEVILADDFDKAHLTNFRAVKEVNRLDSYHGDPQDIRSSFSAGDGWMETSVKICLPADGVKHNSESSAPEFEVPGFHLTPFKMFYRPSGDEPAERVYGEIYNSPVMLEEHERIRLQPREGGCTLETVVAAVMLWSDSTHLASSGTASLWPIYLYLGNQSKYLRGKPTAFVAHHLAYIPKLSDTLQDFYQACFNKPATSEILTFCRHELMHAIWLLLMDDKFMHAYKFGIVIEFLNGVSRRVFPRFFTYSADYPETTLLASIKFLAQCPCPRCLMPKTKIGGIGTKADRRWRENEIREDGNGVWSIINRVCKWLYVEGTNIASVNNASGMKKLAARNFEDLLQCSIPIFEDLLPATINVLVLDLLFELATWQGLAKLRIHTDSTLFFLDTSTTRLGKVLRCFVSETDKEYDTYDLPSEEAARGRQKARKAAQGQPNSNIRKKPAVGSSKRRRLFNFQTYKLHALGDYVNTIRRFGTTDNYSTMLGELEHRCVKHFYPRVSKSQFTSGIAKQQRRERILFQMAEHAPSARSESTGHKKGKGKCQNRKTVPLDAPSLRFEDSEQLPFTDPCAHYHISTGNASDPAFADFLPRLKDHITSRLREHDYDSDEISFTPAERSRVIFINDRIYRHKVLRVNYTSYDLRRAQDSLNPRTHADIMVLSHEDDDVDAHPYWYARIIGVFHAFVIFNDTAVGTSSHEQKQIDFVWVRWFGRDLEHRAGWRAKRLHRVGFIPHSDPGAFRFIDLKQIIRGIHMIPAFTKGHTTDLLPPSIVCHPSENDEDWIYYYVNLFDRNMFMRFRGATRCFFHNRDHLDVVGLNNGGTDHYDDEIIEPSIGPSTTTDNTLELENDSDNELEYEDYGYSGIEQGEDNEDSDEDADKADDNENIDEDDDDDGVDDDLGAEDGKDGDEELEGFDKF
ncbi:hypothetical protein P692DRAFT_20878962 [Suillus brevipes Sb2]|nr:hypothetical protein P692DRAFT_20878962 [Suillus brevipes Sb2]